MATQRSLIAGNWKMNLLSEAGEALARGLARRAAADAPAADIVLCPPAVMIPLVAAALSDSPIAVGGQDCHAEPAGAHTGDISAEMLADAGCRYVIVGHSERRADHGETDGTVHAKAAAAHGAGLIPIVCVGERADQRGADAIGVVVRQLTDSLPEGAGADNTVIAYEPVWAIGSGRTPSLDEIGDMHGHIRTWLDGRSGTGADFSILYGGSVNADNAAEILALDGVDGALVGGASLKQKDFWAIVESCT